VKFDMKTSVLSRSTVGPAIYLFYVLCLKPANVMLLLLA